MLYKYKRLCRIIGKNQRKQKMRHKFRIEKKRRKTMSTHFKRILYGGDYNPNQWTKDIWQEDMRIFKDAHINTATINVFSWAKIQPSEHEYNLMSLTRSWICFRKKITISYLPRPRQPFRDGWCVNIRK